MRAWRGRRTLLAVADRAHPELAGAVGAEKASGPTKHQGHEPFRGRDLVRLSLSICSV